MVKARLSPAAGEALECDLCIIGAGAAGISLAADFIGRAQKVIVVDPGTLDGKLTGQDFYEGEVVSGAHALPHLYRHRRLGGSTAIWGGRCIPYDPIDFEPRDYVAMSGWPFPLAELEPYYATAQEFLHAGAYDYRAATALGGGDLVGGFRDPDVLTESLERFSLPTNVWREHGARLTRSPNVQVIAGATAVRLIRAEGGDIEQLDCVGAPGGKFTVRAGAFVVAAGGLETVRILGFSGIGDHSGLLGRTYMCHVETHVGRLALSPSSRPIAFGFERTLDGVYARRRFTLAAERQRALKVMNVAARPHHPPAGDPAHGHPVLSAMFLAKRFIIPEYARRFAAAEELAGTALRDNLRLWTAHIRNVALGAPALAGFTVDWTRRRYLSKRRIPYVSLPSAAGEYPLDLNAEQEPNPSSRVTLGEDLDRNGVPRLRVDWRVTDLDVRTVTTALREMRAALRRTNCGDVHFDDGVLDDEVRSTIKPVGGHHIGTARMSESPGQGVVDPDGRVHGMRNLYVAGSAVFPTSSQANPTLTIVALTLRLGAHLRSCFDDGRLPH